MRNAASCLGMMAFAAGLSGCSSLPGGEQATIDLSTPQTTVVSFTTAAARGDLQAALKCCLPGGLDYEDMQEVLAPSSNHEMKRMLESIDIRAPMPIVAQDRKGDMVSIVWRVTFARDFHTREGGGHTFKAGSTYDLDATLKKSGKQCLIDGI